MSIEALKQQLPDFAKDVRLNLSGIVNDETLAPEAYAQAHLPGAVNAPPDRLRELAPKLAPAKDAEIVVYCASPT